MLKTELEAKVKELEKENAKLAKRWSELESELRFADQQTQEKLASLSGSLEQIRLVLSFVEKPDEEMAP